MKLSLRPYQEEAVELIEACMAFGSEETIILKAETSFGKSITAAGICEKLGDKHIVILVNIESLIDQIAFFLEELNIDYSILKAGRENEFNTHARVQLVMSQTYYARAEKLKIKADILIQDEIHKEYDTARTKKILDNLQPDQRIGLSATPWTASGYALANSETIETANCETLTKQGYLAPIDYYVPRWAEQLEYSSVKKSGSDYSLQALDQIIASPKHIAKLVKAMDDRKAKQKKTLVFASTIEQCNRIEAELVNAGYDAAAYHSDKSDKENQRIMKSFKENKPFSGSDEQLDSRNLFEDTEPIENGQVIKCLISVSKLTTGFSVDDIDLGVVARPTKVKSLWHQIAGRLRRTSYSLDYWIKNLESTNDLNTKIAMISSVYDEGNKVKVQLKAKGINNIDVFEYCTKRSSLDGYDVVIDNVRPNKDFGEILDLGQCINNHGFPEEAYSPPEYTGFQLVDKKNMQEATGHLRLDHLAATIENDTPELITRKKYDQKIFKIESDSKKLINLSTRELSNKIDISTNPVEIIAATAVLFDKVFSEDNMPDKFGRVGRGYLTVKGVPVVNFLNESNIVKIATPWVEAFEKEDEFYVRKYTKALRTRAKNLFKQQGNIWSLKFFIDFLIKEDAVEKEVANAASEPEEKTTGYEIEFDISDDEIPF